ncbi:hypothetical protein AgCh_034090 [Apium graveolens]
MDLAKRLKDRDERREMEKAEREANAIKKAIELERIEKRSNELKSRGLSRVSENDIFKYQYSQIFKLGISFVTKHEFVTSDLLTNREVIVNDVVITKARTYPKEPEDFSPAEKEEASLDASL